MGRLDLSRDWQSDYDRKLVSAEEAAQTVRSGDHVWWPPGHGSTAFLAALAQRRSELRGVELRGILVPDVGWFEEGANEAFHIASQFGSLFDRHAINAGIVDYHPYWLVGIHKALDAGRGHGEAWEIDKLVLTVSPPNEHGFVSLGGSVWDGVTSARRARMVIAEVNPNVIETFGDSWLHVSEIDRFVPDDRPVVPETSLLEPDAVDRAISQNVAELVHDGDTIQVGVGSHSAALPMLGTFDERQELSYFAELTVPGLVPLAERGVITGRTSALHPNKFVATVIGNTVDERRVVHRNPHYELYGIEYLLDPRVIARNENIVAINGALTVDLSGQIGVHTIGPQVYAGVGGHLAFALGAYFAPKGRYVCVLPSTARGGTVSTIVPQFAAGQIVTVPRDIADTVVTEHGVARLLGKTVRQRADELISIAHPDFRGELRKVARRLFFPAGDRV
jgi:4-hydroxybutyrate CoA-transferase